MRRQIFSGAWIPSRESLGRFQQVCVGIEARPSLLKARRIEHPKLRPTRRITPDAETLSWRSVKYENVYLHAYKNRIELRTGLAEYFKFYNGTGFTRRWSIGHRTRCNTA
jgi:hypothetical protein